MEIRVQDFGEGMPPEMLDHVFDRFYRGEEQSTIHGFGLGLAIAKTLVDGMGGNIEIESEEGKGSIQHSDHMFFSKPRTGKMFINWSRRNKNFTNPKQILQLVQSSFANVNLMNAILGFAWAVAVVMG